jgi:hypothetical protein
MQVSKQSLTDRLYPAESVLAVLARVDLAKFPWEERVAVGVCQVKAMQEWLELFWSEQARLRSEHLFSREPKRGSVPRAKSEAAQSLSSYLVDRAHSARQ